MDFTGVRYQNVILIQKMQDTLYWRFLLTRYRNFGFQDRRRNILDGSVSPFKTLFSEIYNAHFMKLTIVQNTSLIFHGKQRENNFLDFKKRTRKALNPWRTVVFRSVGFPFC